MMRNAKSKLGPQAGITPMELMVAGFLGALLLGCGGYLFTTQVRGYNDIQDQARIQADLKKAVQAMTRQISNAGACMPDPRKGFSAGHDKLSFNYIDVKKRFCLTETDAITMTFYSQQSKNGGSLIQEIRCPGMTTESRTLATLPGNVSMSFSYYDKDGVSTSDVNKIKSVQLDMSLQSRGTPAHPGMVRKQSVQVDCVNLI